MKDKILEIKNLNIGKVEEDASLKKYTTYCVGGTCSCIVFPKNVECLIKLIKFLRNEQIPYKLLGKGSNLLFSSKEYEGVLINGNYEIVKFIEKNIKVEVLNDCKSKKNSNDNNNKDNDFSIHLIDDEEENFEENSSEEEESYSYFNGKSKNNIKFKSTNNSSFYSNFKNIYD